MSTRSKDKESTVAKAKADAAELPSTSAAVSGAAAATSSTSSSSSTETAGSSSSSSSSSSSTTTTSPPKAGRSSERVKSSTATTSSSSTTTATNTTTSSSSSTSTTPATTAMSTSSASSSNTASSATRAKYANGDVNVPPEPSSKRSGASVPSLPSPSENAPPSSQVNASKCTLCGTTDVDAPEVMMACRCCGGAFHARCANLPQTPEEGEFFCRWDCYTAFRKSQDLPPKTPLDDFSRISSRVQSILGDMPRRPPPPAMPPHAASDPNSRVRERSKRALPTTTRSRSVSPYDQTEAVNEDPGHFGGPRPTNGYPGERFYGDDVVAMDRRAPPSTGRSPVHTRPFRAPMEVAPDDDLSVPPPPPRSPRSRPMRTTPRQPVDDAGFDDADSLRGKRAKYLAQDEVMATGPPPPSRVGLQPRRNSHTPPGRSNGSSGAYTRDGHPQFYGSGPQGMEAADIDRRQAYLQRDGVGRHGLQGMGPTSSMLPPVDNDPPPSSRPSSGHRSRVGSAGTYREPVVIDEYDPPPPSQGGMPRSRPRSAERYGDKRVPGQSPAIVPGKYNIPWKNPSAFPAGLHQRFDCQPDDLNGVFRIDLTPVFGHKTMHLYQSEIDFFFRCFESPDVSLVVKGMASELNPYIWAWPFILESCGSETHFSFDHFQFRHKPGELPELEYVGELRLSMAAYNAYLERYLSGSMAKDVVVLEDHVTKKPITLVAAENIIALNDLVLADHCAQLHNDLLKSFQWDVFAGGIHCLLQYLPPTGRHKRFASPLLHFNFPGARGRLRDPGNGTTDQAYQVLVGSLELVIFERLEPKDRDAFHRVLRAAGYDADKKAMLLDSHLRVLRDAGFAWSTVLLGDGEFVHVNKGRLHFWRVVEPDVVRAPAVANAPCVFLSWEWVYQGVSQRGISTECWFAMKNMSLSTGGWAFDPRRAIVEAAKCGVAIVRTGQFLSSLSAPSAPPVLRPLAFSRAVGNNAWHVDREVVLQRQEQMVLFLESILPCMDAIVEEEFDLGLAKDDSDDFRKIFDDEVMWKVVDASLSARHPLRVEHASYDCGICGLELTNIYKQCLGCTVHARRARPNVKYALFRICLRCHAQPEHHHFKPRVLHGFYDKLCSSEGHTGLLPATRRYQAERSYFKCRCAPYVRCTYCGGCESCCCLCHTLFQTRFRFAAPDYLDHLRADVVDVIKRHKQPPPAPPSASLR